jgi:hypothetical protein
MEQKFKLKDNNEIRIPELIEPVVNNNNLTFNKALDVLCCSRDWIELFSEYPDDWKLNVAKRELFYQDLDTEKKMDIILRYMSNNISEIPLSPNRIVANAELYIFDKSEAFLILSMMADDGYVYQNQNQHGKKEAFYQIRYKGIVFLNKGGYYELRKKAEQERKFREEIEKISLEKIKYDLNISKFQSRYKWLPLILSGVAIAISVLSYFFKK